MRTADVVGAYEAKTKFSELLERVERGAEVTVTRHGMPVARIVPIQRPSTSEDRAKAIEAMMEARRGCRLGAGLKIRDLIAEGRR